MVDDSGVRGNPTLLSSLPGRERWEFRFLRRRPRLTEAVRASLVCEPSILSVSANSMTGRILVHYDVDLSAAALHGLVVRAYSTHASRLRSYWDLPVASSRSAGDGQPEPSPLRDVVVSAATGVTVGLVLAPPGAWGLIGFTSAISSYAVYRLLHVWRDQIFSEASRRLLEVAEPQRRRLYFGVACGTAYVVLSIARYAIIGLGVDLVVNKESSFLSVLGIGKLSVGFVTLGAVGMAATALGSTLRYLAQSTWRNAAQEVQEHLRIESYSHVQLLGPAYMDAKGPTNVALVLNSDISNVEQWFDAVWDMMVIGARVIVIGTMFLVIAPEVAWLTVPSVGAVVVALNLLRRRIVPLLDERAGEQDRLSSRLSTNVSGLGTIMSYTAEDHEARRIQQLIAQLLDRNRGVIGVTASVAPILELIIMASTVATMIAASRVAQADQLSAGSYTVLTLLSRELDQPVTLIGSVLERYQKSTAAVGRVFDLLDEKPQIPLVEGSVRLPTAAVRGDICLDDVWFGYTEQAVIRGLTLHIPAGSTVAVVGPTGSGKSTLVRLLLRFYEIESGTITLDDHRVQDLSLRDTRAAISYVAQDDILFPDTVAENILFGSSGADYDSAVKAAEIAQAGEFIAALPNGFHTEVGERGARLSAGQRQRLLLARAIRKDAPILVLDEATSALDQETEAIIYRELRRLARGKTTIIITHRLRTIRAADTIFVVEDGRIREQGTHGQLIELNGLYSSLLRGGADQGR